MATSSPQISLVIPDHEYGVNIYQKTFNDGKDSGFVYWLPNQKILGVWIDELRFFEATLNDSTRQKLLLNCSPALLEAKWKDVFKREAIEIHSVTKKVAIVRYSRIQQELPLITDPAVHAERFRHILLTLDSDKLSLEKIIEDLHGKPQAKERALQAPGTDRQAAYDRNRRARPNVKAPFQ